MPFVEVERWERGYGMGVDGCDSCVEVGKCWCKLRRCLPFMRRDGSSGCVYDRSGAVRRGVDTKDWGKSNWWMKKSLYLCVWF